MTIRNHRRIFLCLITIGIALLCGANLLWADSERDNRDGQKNTAAVAALQTQTRAEKDIPLVLDAPQPKSEQRDGIGHSVLWLLGFCVKLALVLALAYGCLILLRRYMPGVTPMAATSEMTVRGALSLGPGRGLHLLDVGGKRLLIASTAQQIQILAEFPATPEAEPAAPADAPDESGFREQLANLLGEMGAATAAAPAPAPTGRVPLASILGKKEIPEPETLTDEELREEVRRTLFTHNRSAEGIARLREAGTEKE